MSLRAGDLCDANAITHLINDIKPDEVYNLGAQSHVAVSFKMPLYTADVDATGTLVLLEAIRLAGLQNKTRFYQASTSELYGKVQAVPQDEDTPFYPRSPYACAKLMAFWVTKNYREAYGMFTCNGILFNHESPRRGEIFVTRKITLAIAAIVLGQQEFVTLGCVARSSTLLSLTICYENVLRFLRNIDAKRDWGHARDYVFAMWKMLQLVSQMQASPGISPS